MASLNPHTEKGHAIRHIKPNTDDDEDEGSDDR